jgi:hypothetical protein
MTIEDTLNWEVLVNNDKVNAVLQQIVDLVAAAGLTAVRHPAHEPLPPSSFFIAIRHARWMCEAALTMPPEKLEKKMRWLGFAQGILWCAGMQSIEEAKQANKPAGEGGAQDACC